MTDEQRNEIEELASRAGDTGPLLRGRPAQWVMFGLSELLVLCPMLFWIPEFDGWRAVVAWLAALTVMAVGPAIAALIPRELQEQYRQALVDSAEARRRAVQDAEMAQAFARSIARRPDGSNGNGGDLPH